MEDNFKRCVEIIAKLRDKNGGCPWDLEQTHHTLKPYLIEECYETLDAIDNDPGKLREELGDVLLQVLLHSQIASEEKRFDINDVLQLLGNKLVERHPHVFGDTKVTGVSDVMKNWEKIKREKKVEEGALSGVPTALPALVRAQRISEKVARLGFDWDNLQEVKEKVLEELNEFFAEVDKNSSAAMEEEFGDLLFTIIQFARKLDFSAEISLADACTKFSKRFSELEKKAGNKLGGMSHSEMEEIWKRVKSEEASRK